MDVAAAGEANAAAYRTGAAAKITTHPVLAALVDLLEDAAPSTNVDSEKIALYNDAGAVLDTRSVWIARCGDSNDGIIAFERAQGSWLPRREGFEGLWDAGRRFVYAVANPTGSHPGLLSYGPFCLVIQADRVSGPNSAVFPGNTAQLYGRETGPPDTARAYADVGCWSFVADMAVVVFGDEATTTPQAEWPQLVCNEDRFLEVVTAGPINLADVVEVRLSAATQADLNAWTVLERRGALTDSGQRNAVAAWRVIRQWINTRHTHIQLRIL